MWFDSHCHLHLLDEPKDAVVERARASGVEGMLVLGTDATSSKQALELTSIDGVWAGAGIHPTDCEGFREWWLDEIDALLAAPGAVAVGETGIDLYRDRSYLDDQRAAFLGHIELAKKHDKALVIHTRESIDEALEMLVEVGAPSRLVFHCWSGDAEQLQRALDLGAHISFAGNVTFKNASDLRAVAPLVPPDRLLVETDSPYLAPVPHRGKGNEPAFVVHVGQAIAGARGEAEVEVATQTTNNAKSLFGLTR